MKKISILLISCLTGVSVFLTSCSEDHYGPEPVDVTANYSNKLSNPNPNLNLTYSGETMIGKSVDFSTVIGETANITLYNIIPGDEALKMTNIPISGDKTGYSFTGNATGTLGTSFKYAGRIEVGQFTLEITDIQLAANAITTQRQWYTIPYTGEGEDETDPSTGIEYTNATYGVHFHSDNENVSSLAGIVEAVAGNILGSVLRSINFCEDGNITARYASMPQVEGGIFGYFMPLPIRPESDYNLSPINLATYYIKGNSLYVIPNIEMIFKQLQSNKTRAISVTDMKEILELIDRWLTTGIRFNIVSEIKPESLFNDGSYIKHTGDMMLYVDKSEVGILFNLLPLLKDVIPDSDMKETLVQLLDMLVPELIASKVFELGIVLQKEYSAEIPETTETPALLRSNSRTYQKNMELLNKVLKK